MANVVELLDKNNVPEELKGIFLKLEEKYGEVPAPMRALANHPEYFKVVLNKMDVVMGSDALELKTKLALAYTISVLNNCEFCITMYAQQLRDAGYTDKQFIEILAVIDAVGSMNHLNNGMLIKPGK
jgi:AhpD family alkylhydroperoxidase